MDSLGQLDPNSDLNAKRHSVQPCSIAAATESPLPKIVLFKILHPNAVGFRIERAQHFTTEAFDHHAIERADIVFNPGRVGALERALSEQPHLNLYAAVKWRCQTLRSCPAKFQKRRRLAKSQSHHTAKVPTNSH